LEWLEENCPELAVMDIAMPVMDGMALLHQLRADPRFQKLPVLVVTASSHEEARVIAGVEGANGFLTKPVSSQDLLEAVDRLLSR
jgi:CheY-like chemotaxis protein